MELKQKVVLGIHIGHDRGACIIKNGIVLAAIAQERLDRKKYSRSYNIPFEAIDHLLEYCKLNIKQVCCIGFSCDAVEGQSIMELSKQEFSDFYNIAIPFIMVSHHDAHAYSTYYSSGFDNSIILIADGGGDYIGNSIEAETVYIANRGHITKISQRLQAPTIRRMGDQSNYIYPIMPTLVRNAQISLARKYEQFTYLLGFGWGEAGKTMGLASYGTPAFYYESSQVTDLHFSLTYGDLLDDIFAKQQLSGLGFKQFTEKNREDIANTVQYHIQKAIVSLVNALMHRYNCKTLCLAGGLFLNCLSNQQIITQCQPDKLFILPCAGDDGQALGCAYYAYTHFFGLPKCFDIQLPYLGLSYTDATIENAIKAKSLSYRILPNDPLAECMAKYIAENKILGLHRGRTEIGPRALCHRSILANPVNPEMKDILNNRVKHREPFRPFAPTVTAEAQYTFFDLNCSSDYMLLATEVREQYQNILASVTHVDNTARVQAVSNDQEPFIHQLLSYLEKYIGVPVVLNTSFNIAGEPIVETPTDAIETFLKTDIDILVIGNYIIENKSFKR